MSASLVGSEMCIRDSHSTALATKQSGHCMQPVWDQQYTTTNIHGGSAVSYTHLTLPTICSV
eukprot:12518747-Alexandrium_andersonii.AAC.1